jgi:hypothetical protein
MLGCSLLDLWGEMIELSSINKVGMNYETYHTFIGNELDKTDIVVQYK